LVRPARNTICPWYDRDAGEAAGFCAATFPDSSVDAVHRAPGDYPSETQGDALVVYFPVMGIPCPGLDGGAAFRQTEGFSFQAATDDQEETDRCWNALVGNGGQERSCGRRRDQEGLSCQAPPGS
jgi:2-polyprenyl-6-hydroxyphenyl methylase/3-demethylubiquinone-9 3-methyltransferase